MEGTEGRDGRTSCPTCRATTTGLREEQMRCDDASIRRHPGPSEADEPIAEGFIIEERLNDVHEMGEQRLRFVTPIQVESNRRRRSSLSCGRLMVMLGAS